VTVDASFNGRALQFQGANTSGNTETISQTGGGSFNQAGQAQGNNGNVASITQTGGVHNMAVQNQGILPGQTGFMSISGGFVARHP
ncbi:MAG TPA: hypothetical protein VFT77_09095, partial [Reyranella sp.]|nr:hypothetical protein [Reyranella sp.]